MQDIFLILSLYFFIIILYSDIFIFMQIYSDMFRYDKMYQILESARKEVDENSEEAKKVREQTLGAKSESQKCTKHSDYKSTKQAFNLKFESEMCNSPSLQNSKQVFLC